MATDHLPESLRHLRDHLTKAEASLARTANRGIVALTARRDAMDAVIETYDQVIARIRHDAQQRSDAAGATPQGSDE